MEDVGGDVGDSDGHVGGPQDLEDCLEDTGGRPEVLFASLLSNLLLVLTTFFCTGRG